MARALRAGNAADGSGGGVDKCSGGVHVPAPFAQAWCGGISSWNASTMGGVREELAATVADLGRALRGKAKGFEGERCLGRLHWVEWRWILVPRLWRCLSDSQQTEVPSRQGTQGTEASGSVRAWWRVPALPRQLSSQEKGHGAFGEGCEELQGGVDEGSAAGLTEEELRELIKSWFDITDKPALKGFTPMLDSWRCRREVRCGLENVFPQGLVHGHCGLGVTLLSDSVINGSLRNLSQLCASSPLRRCQTATGATILRTRIHITQFWMQCPTITRVNCWMRVWPTESWDGWLWPATSHWIACVTIGTCSLRLTVTWTMEWLQGQMCLQRSSENPTPGEGFLPISPHFSSDRMSLDVLPVWSRQAVFLLFVEVETLPMWFPFFFRLADVRILRVAVACHVSLDSCLYSLEWLVQTSA